MHLSPEDLKTRLELRSVRTIQMNAEITDEEWDDDYAADKPAHRVTAFAAPGEFGLAWRIRLWREGIRVSAGIVTIYDVPDEIDLRSESHREVLEEFVRTRGVMDVQGHIAALAASAEGILARTAVPPPSASGVTLINVIDVSDDDAEEQRAVEQA
jgi:hypothetical protein